MTPITRKEMFLAKLSGEDVTTPYPITREELFLAKLCGESVETPAPITRYEFFLDGLAGNEHTLTPFTRLEHFLAAAGGADVPELSPVTREEVYWSNIEISGVEWTIISGVSPLTLVNAVAKGIRSLVQYGKVTTVGGELYCNNGKMTAVDDELPAGYKRLLGITFDGNFHYRTGEALTGDDDVTMTLNNLSASGKNVFGSYNGANDKNFSMYIYGSASSSSYFRYGDQLKRPKYGGTGRRTITFGASGTSGFAEDSDVTPDEFTTPANTYIGMLPNSSSAAYTGDIVGSILVSNRLKWIPCEQESDGVIGYYEKFNGNFIAPSGSGTPVSLGYDTSHLTVLSVEGAPEVLTVGTQTASVANLYAAGNVADEQDIISGAVTRRTEVVVSGGVVTVTALAEPVTEQVTAQHLRTVIGDNTVSVTSDVGSVQLEVEYAKAGA